MKKYFLIAVLFLLLCISCQSVEPPVSTGPTPIPTVSATPAPAPTPEPEPDPTSVNVTLGYWETNSFRLSDGLIYQFKDDGSYDSWYMNGAFSPSGRYTYEDWILVLQDNIGQEMDRFYYALETSQFISIMTERVAEQEHVDNNGVFVPAQIEPTTLTWKETPSEPSPYEGIVPSTVSIDLSDPVMYRNLNIFLSNFSECRFSSYSVENPDYGELADFAFMHAWINSPSVIENCDKYFNDEYAAIDTCVTVPYIEKVAQYFFAGKVDVSEIESAWKNGHGRGLITNGAYGYGFTLADSITDLGENRFEVQFHVYTVPYSDAPTYDYSSTSAIYSARPDNLPQPLYNQGSQFTGTPGSATFEAVQKEDGSLSFFLRTYSI